MGLDDDLTRALNSADRADHHRLLANIHDDLRRIARAELSRHRRGETLNTQALVHEAYLKLFGGVPAAYENRKHFFATAARAMRQVVIDHARARLADSRGAGAEHVPLEALEGQPLPVDANAEQLVAIDAALARLEAMDPRLVEVVELRFFAGLDVVEVAELLGVSEPTIKRDTRTARAFLSRELTTHA